MKRRSTKAYELAQVDEPGPDQLVPVKAGEVRTGVVADIAFGGEGVVRVDGFVVFLPYVCEGEEIEFEVTEVRKQFARGRLVRVLQPSPGRVQPRCAYYMECGGCQYQHIRYEDQVAIKHRQITELFRRIGQFHTPIIDPVIPCPNPYEYRNRLMLRSQWNKPERRLTVGFLRGDSRFVVDVDSCAIAEPALNEQIRQVRANPPPKGGLKVVIRIAPEGWTLPRDSFFQNNFLLLPKMVETVRARLAEGGCRYLIDAYCGIGFFSVELGDLVEGFVGVDVDRPAIESARKNAAARGLTNGEYLLGMAELVMPALLARFKAESTAVILDPPRTGCRPEGLAALMEVRPKQILYVSCHPATLARDLGILCANNLYQVERVTPLDMFPQTQHVECVTDLRLVG